MSGADVESDAAKKQKWETECKSVATTHFEIKDSDIREVSGKRVARLSLKLCDFANILSVPTVQLLPATAKRTILQVAYKCPVKVSYVGGDYTDTSGPGVCSYGYDAEDGETAPEFKVSAAFAPGTTGYDLSQLRLNRLTLVQNRAGHPYGLTSEFGIPPFGSHAGCYRQALEFSYEQDGRIKIARAKYKKLTGDNGAVVWSLENEATLPPYAQMILFYRNAAANSKTMMLYRICEWSPEVMGEDPGTAVRP